MAQRSRQHGDITNNSNSFNSFNQTVHINRVTNDEKGQILQWLSPLEPQERHQSVRTDRFDGVGNWLLEKNEFQRWSNHDTGSTCIQPPVLFCYGNPGVGKTHLSSLVIDGLCDATRGQDIAIVGLYCDFKAQQEQTTTSILGAILKQLVARGEIPDQISQAFQNAKTEFGGRCLRLPDMVDILKKTIASLPQVFICVDALDEALPRNRLELLRSLRDIINDSSNARLYLTGRPQIQKEILENFPDAVMIPIIPAKKDIEIFLEKSLDRDTEPDAMDDNLRAEIMRKIPETVSEIFLLVSLYIEAILGEMTIHGRRKKLCQIPKGSGLKEAYAATLGRIKAQKGSKSRLGMEVLMWISHTKRLLHVAELCHALGVEKRSTDLNTENIPAIQVLLGCSLGLVTVDASSSTVRLVHFTLQEYLSRDPSLFHSPHSMIAEVCLTYLNFQCVRDISPALWWAPLFVEHVPFVRYASCYWGTHARRGITENVKLLAVRLLDGFENHISSRLLVLHEGAACACSPRRGIWGYAPARLTGLLGAACLGLVEITVALLGIRQWDLNAADSNGDTAVAWAASRGHEKLLDVLLDMDGVNPDTMNADGNTPLLIAASKGYEGVAKILLERGGANPNTTDKYGNTPFLLAAFGGHEGATKLLLERNDVDLDITNEDGNTPLLLATSRGHEGVVKLLLERNLVSLNTANEYGQTPLMVAASKGHGGVIRMLLEPINVNSDTADYYGQTPLTLATSSGHQGVVEMPIERKDVNPKTMNENLNSLLLLAASRGHEGVVKTLLEQSDVNPDTMDEYGETPLAIAASNGHSGVVEMLLERSDFTPDMTDKHGNRPLFYSTIELDLTERLLHWTYVIPGTKDEDRNMLRLASLKKRLRFLKMLAEGVEKEIERKPNERTYPFSTEPSGSPLLPSKKIRTF